MDIETRCHIVSCIRGVDFVIPFEIDNDQTVCEALRRIRPQVFTKGGDRVDFTNIPEWAVCQELGIELISQVGRPKLWSSSDFLKEWGEFAVAKAGQENQQLVERPAASTPGFAHEPISRPGRNPGGPKRTTGMLPPLPN